jgi:hypothetical protein
VVVLDQGDTVKLVIPYVKAAVVVLGSDVSVTLGTVHGVATPVAIGLDGKEVASTTGACVERQSPPPIALITRTVRLFKPSHSSSS